LNSRTSPGSSLLNPENIFRLFKYSIYLLLTYNAFLFFGEDLAASAETFGENISWRNVIEAYSATFDTAAWVVLLLLFELETAVIPDHLLKGGLKWVLKGLAAIAYFFIVYSFYGYCVKYGVVSNLLVFNVADVCSLVGSEFTWVDSLDEYLPLDQESCNVLNGQALVQIAGTSIIGTQAALADAIRLTIVDIINASNWLIIVALLEVEVLLQLKNKLTDKMMATLKYSKGFLYLILFFCAAYWGIEGTFLDFWDAFLWLVAFIFIELNIFQWHSETEEEKEHILKV
jgi:hypothetical protein